MSERISLQRLEAMSQDDLFDMFESVTDEQAVDSDIGGDSDADDDLPQLLKNTSPGTPRCSRNAGPDGPDTSHTTYPTTGDTSDSLDASDSSDNDSDISEENLSFGKSVCNLNVYPSTNFTQPFGPKIEVNIESPLEIFLSLFPDSMLKEIVKESNLYAVQKGSALETNQEEIKAFLGLLIVMGFHKLPSIRHYWSSDPNFYVSRVAEVMSMKRFLKILRFLHLNDSSKMPQKGMPGYDKLYKMRPLLTCLKKQFLNSFNISRYVSIDESMVAFKGRTSLKQYMPLKPTKRGFKVWVAACSVTAYMLTFQVYEGKTATTESGPLGERVVLALSESLENLGYCVFFDRFFTGITLLSKLLSKCIFGCGTILQTRKLFPRALLKTDKQLQLGDSDFAMKGDMSVTKWKDRGSKAVVMASTFHNPQEQCQVSRTNKIGQKEKIPCPKVVADYNKYMGGVDTFDQYMASYSISWKSRRWWLKLFYYFLDAAVVNSYIMYKETVQLSETCTVKPISHLKYRSALGNQLIGNYTSRKKCGPTVSPKVIVTKNKFARKGEASGSGDGSPHSDVIQMQNVGMHLPSNTTPRRCGYCSTKKNPKRSRIMCSHCNVALCIGCFAPFHKL